MREFIPFFSEKRECFSHICLGWSVRVSCFFSFFSDNRDTSSVVEDDVTEASSNRSD